MQQEAAEADYQQLSSSTSSSLAPSRLETTLSKVIAF